MTFKEAHRDFQMLARELDVLRRHNLRFREGDSQETLLLFAEGALVLVVLERFLRMIVPAEATEKDISVQPSRANRPPTLRNLLEKASSPPLSLLKLPGAPEQVIREVTDVRNTLLHGNFEQAAQQAHCKSVQEYFKTQLAPEVEQLFKLTDFLVSQIDTETGKPRQR